MKTKSKELTTYKTTIFKDFLFRLFLASQISKCINNNTENQVKNDDNNNEEKQQIINNTRHKVTILKQNKEKQSISSDALRDI